MSEPTKDFLAVVNAVFSPAYDLHNLHCNDQPVLLRVDFNVPLSPDHQRVADDTRISAALPSIRLLLAKQARLVLLSHLGRPDAIRNSLEGMQTQYSLAPVAKVLLSELGKDFAGFVRSCIGEDVAAAIATLPAGRVILLENTRFHAGEMGNDSRFAEQLASPFKILVNDAFAVLHRRQASVTGIAEHVPVVLPGLLVRKEIEALSRILFSPTRPLVVVLGGAKVEDKIDIIDSLSCRASKILVGGRMAFPFLYANGVLVGATQIGGKLQTQLAKDIELRARQRGVDFILPDDQIVASKLQPQATTSIVPLTLTCCTNELEPCIPEGLQGGDIGPATAKRFSNALEGAGTIFWNGPMGVYELPEFFSGTKSVAHAMAIATQHGSVTVVGGGDSAAAIRKAGLVADNFTHICTGGGASLEVLQGKILPGLQIFKS